MIHILRNCLIVIIISEQSTNVGIFRFFLLFFDWLGSLSLGWGSSGGSGWGSWGSALQRVQKLDWDISFQSNRGNIFESGSDQVWNGEDIWLSDGEGDSSELISSISELGEQVFWLHVEDFWGKDSSVVVDVEDFHTEREWLDIQLSQKDSFGVSDLSSLIADLVILGDFDLTLLNLGGDVQGVEETDLRGIQTSWSWWDDDFQWGEGSDLSWGWDSVTFNDWLEVEDGGIGEDETNLSLAQVQELFDLWNFSVESLSEFEVLIIFLWGFKSDVDGLLDDSVFTADHITELLLSQSKSDLLDLVGSDVLQLDNEALLVVGEVFVESVDNTALLCSLG